VLPLHCSLCPSRSLLPLNTPQESLELFDLRGAAYESKPRSTPNMLGAMVASGLFGTQIKSNPEIHDVIRGRDRPALMRGDEQDSTVAPANSTRDTGDYFHYGSASSHLHVAAAEGHVNSVRVTFTARGCSALFIDAVLNHACACRCVFSLSLMATI
jgi:hypothetical protein